MKSIISKSIVVAFASAATLATQALAQVPTNVVNQIDVTALINGTYSVPAATLVKGVDAASTYLRSAVSVASTIKVGYTSKDETITSASGLETYTYEEKFANYAYGNVEILKLALASSNVTGWSLAYTNAWKNGAYPLSSGALVALKTNTAPVSAVTNWFAAALGDNGYLNSYTTTNDVTTKDVYNDYYQVGYTLGGGNAGDGFGASGVLSAPTITWKNDVQTFSSGKVTNGIYTGAFSGSFSGTGNSENND